MSYLFTDPLLAVLAFDSMFDDRVIGRPSVHKCNSVQRDTNADEVEDFVDEGAKKCQKKALINFWPLDITHNDTNAIRGLIEKDVPPSHNDSSIFESQFHGVISPAGTFAIMRPSPQNREFLIEIAINEWQ